MLALALLPLLVFEHGFIQILFGIFKFFCFCFMSNNTIKFYSISFLCKHNFLLMRNIQKQSPRVVLWERCSWKFHKIHSKTPVPGVFLRPATLLKNRLWYRFFFLWILWNFLQNTSGGCFCKYTMNVGYLSKSISWKYFMFHKMTLKLYFMKCSERKISQCILPLRTPFFIEHLWWLLLHWRCNLQSKGVRWWKSNCR